ncbi:hypothetical protein CC80DRAFT_489642 [Byssothecium circinans]|uniref:Core domain-containing protein n=1 Tax=Byssothecium circinans TaxID=147558 RepID=A0A6A5U6B6_9PLEO|nr:hypothetical protein CC80DRAFT_489642 [Byssothecium circinans]
MAPPSTMCSSCLRAAQRASRTISRSQPSNLARKAYTTATATTRPLYRDPRISPTKRTLKTTSTIIVSARELAYNPVYPPRRSLATTTTPTSAPSDPRPARAILNPRKTEAGNEMRILFSPRAAERLATIAATDANPNLALRITIESGGCHGFQYLMDLTDLSKNPATEEDTVFEGDKGAKAIVDEASLELLNGSTVDYTMELIGSQFKVTGIPGATSSCGCGTSFDIKL